jgi:hypothetical protein
VKSKRNTNVHEETTLTFLAEMELKVTDDRSESSLVKASTVETGKFFLPICADQNSTKFLKSWYLY